MPPAIMGLLPIISGVASAGASAVKYIGDKNQAAKDRTLASETQRYSPWTGLKAEAPHDPNLGEAIGGGLAGALATGQTVAKLGAPAAPTAPTAPTGGDYGAGMTSGGAPSLGVNTNLGGADPAIAQMAAGGGPPTLFKSKWAGLQAPGANSASGPKLPGNYNLS